MRLLSHRYYDILIISFVLLFVLSNIAATKLVAIGPFILDGGFILFPLTYIIGDIISEVYGFKRAMRIIIIGAAANIVTALLLLATQYLPSAPAYEHQLAFENVLGFVPQITIASTVAFFFGQLLNSYVLTQIKRRWGEKRLWIRFITSSFFGQLLDTTIFALIAFFGILTGWELINYIAVGVGLKLAVEIVLLPLVYKIVSIMRQRNQE